MSKPYNHQYLSTPGSSCGTMVCGACGQPITNCEYRSYQRSDKDEGWRFVTHHRDCCANDAGWAKLDAARASSIDRDRIMLAQAEAFRDRWNVDDLDDLIDDLFRRAPPIAPEETAVKS